MIEWKQHGLSGWEGETKKRLSVKRNKEGKKEFKMEMKEIEDLGRQHSPKKINKSAESRRRQ